ncbi:MAG: hypothetical protein JO362_22005 [Streptomycetaceae bacterium]|nr:hypothetical protein [Streptomycetaceae bacterium]
MTTTRRRLGNGPRPNSVATVTRTSQSASAAERAAAEAAPRAEKPPQDRPDGRRPLGTGPQQPFS